MTDTLIQKNRRNFIAHPNYKLATIFNAMQFK